MKTRLILALVATAPMAAHATDGYFANGYGMKSIGMGGAAVAVAQEPFGGAVNPGAMSLLGNEWQFGAAWFQPLREASRTGSGPAGLDGAVGSESRSFIIPEFGINWKYRPDLAFGVTVYGNGGMNTDYPGGQISVQSACGSFRQGQGAPYNLLCGTGTLGVDMSQLMIAPYVSWEFMKGHSVGIAPVIAYQRFELTGMQAFAPFSTSPGNLTNNGHDSSWGLGVRVGYMGQLTDMVSVGIAYASKINGSFDNYKGIFAEAGGFDIPSSFTAGIAVRPTAQWLLAFDFERIWYDDARSVNNPGALIFNCAFQGQANACLGGSNGAGFGWQNVNVFKVGAQYMLNDSWTLRAGYNHTQNPIKPSDVTFNIIAPGVVQNQWSMGTTYRIDRQSEVTGSFMYAAHNSVTGTSLFAGNPPNGFGAPPTTTETIGMKQYLAGLAYSRKF